MYDIRTDDHLRALLAWAGSVPEALRVIDDLADETLDQLLASGDDATDLHLPFVVLRSDEVVVRSLVVLTTTAGAVPGHQ